LLQGKALITETVAICAYLADQYPEKNLIPPVEHPARANYFRWLFSLPGRWSKPRRPEH
jgi:glutathione S-transferase